MLQIDSHECLLCAGCISVCPETALYHDLSGLQVIHRRCTLCRMCVKFCPVAALKINYEEVS